MWLADIGLGIVLSAVVGVIAGGISGCAMELGILKVLRERESNPEIQLLASFGLLVLFQNLIALFWGDSRSILWGRTAETGTPLLGGHVAVMQVTTVGFSFCFHG